jgi:hypothetical protein
MEDITHTHSISVVDRFIVIVGSTASGACSLSILQNDLLTVPSQKQSASSHETRTESTNMAKFSGINSYNRLYSVDIGQISKTLCLMTTSVQVEDRLRIVVLIADMNKIKCWEYQVEREDEIKLVLFNHMNVTQFQAMAVGISDWIFACKVEDAINIYVSGLLFIHSITMPTKIQTMCFLSSTTLLAASENAIHVR